MTFTFLFLITSLCIIGSRFIHLIRTDSNAFPFMAESESESEVAQSCPTLCDAMNCSTSGLPVHHQIPESTQTHGH